MEVNEEERRKKSVKNEWSLAIALYNFSTGQGGSQMFYLYSINAGQVKKKVNSLEPTISFRNETYTFQAPVSYLFSSITRLRSTKRTMSRKK